MRKNIFLFGLIVTLVSCKPGIPEDVIKPATMRDILINIHFVDGYLTTFTNTDSARKSASVYYTSVYKKFGIDSAAYAHSMNYYYKNPDKLNAIYKEVTEALNKRLKSEEKVANKNVVSQ